MNISHLKCLTRMHVPQKVLLTGFIYFFHWLTIMFNKVDITRVHQLGPDRVCAEWCLRNGASIQWVGVNKMLSDYNSLPKEGTTLYIKKIDATNSSISHHGFLHLKGCNFINEFILDSCGYIENEALKQLSIIKKTLNHLKVSNCGNITQNGLEYLKDLKQLRTLQLSQLNYVHNKKDVLKMLESNLPSCQITHDFEPKKNIAKASK